MNAPHQLSPRVVFFIFAVIGLFGLPLVARSMVGYPDRPMRYILPAEFEHFYELFPPPVYKSLTIGKVGNGTVTSIPSGINCGSTCSAQFVQNTVVNLFVTADPDWVFDSWTGACSGSDSCTVTLTDSLSVTANFKPYIIVERKGSGAGTITSDPAGISCGAACTTPRPYGTTITLYATPDAGQYFWGWTGDCRGTGPCTVTMDRVRYAAAWFGGYIATTLLDLSLAGMPPSGQVTSNISGINCNNYDLHGYFGCEAMFPLYSEVRLTPTIYATNYFTEWSGACAESSPDFCDVYMYENREVSAAFYPTARITLNVYRDPSFSNGGSVTLTEPAGATCAVDNVTADRTCTYYYPTRFSFNVTLTANPDDGATWNWGQDCGFAGTGQTCTITVSNIRPVNVDLSYIPQVVLNVHGQGSGGGWVEVTPTKPACVAQPYPIESHTCIYSFPGGTEVILTPHPDAGYTSTWYQRCDEWGSAACYFHAWPGETFTADIDFYLSSS